MLLFSARFLKLVEAAAALTTKTLQSLFYNNGNNSSTDNITAGVAA